MKLMWISVEIHMGKIYIYQASDSDVFLVRLMVKNALLIDTHPKQVITVNCQILQ